MERNQHGKKAEAHAAETISLHLKNVNEMFVTRAKQKKLIRAANMYLQHKHLTKEVRFDVIGIVKSGNKVVKSYVKGAFGAWDETVGSGQ